MIKLILTLAFFAMVAASLKPVPSVSQLTENIKETCKGDICGKQ